MKSKGCVYLVGAGPGDDRLLTLRGAELLSRADVVVCDALVNPALVRRSPGGARILLRGRDFGHDPAELAKLLVTHAREGKTVVRLKGGDPYVFGRGGEEAEALAAAQIPFEVVPGVSSVTAVPNYAGIPLTHRGVSSSFTVVTGHEDPTKAESGIDWVHFAGSPGTKVILMGAGLVGQLVARLVEAGMAPATPVAMIRWGTTSQQRAVTGTLETIAALTASAGLTAPAVLVVGEVVRLRDRLNWYESRALFGKKVVVTRSRDQAGSLTDRLREEGAEVLEIPCIKIGPPTRMEPLIEAIGGLGAYDWIIFTSANGVTSFFQYFFRAFEDLRDLGAVRLAAVGPATAARLQELHLKVDLTPADYIGREIVKALMGYQSLENVRILLLRAEVASPDLPRLLEDQGAIVDDIAGYRTLPETEDRDQSGERLVQGGADWLTFTSGSTVEHFHARFDLPALLKRHAGLRVATIGPETTKAFAAISAHPVIEARPHTIEGLVRAIVRAGTPPG